MSNLIGVACGVCNEGPIYFEACPEHHWAIASECQRCGERNEIAPCRDCGRTSRFATLDDGGSDG